MVITSDFNTFANNYHEQNGTTRSDIMCCLPNNIIMDITRQADGGIKTHKLKLNKVLAEFHKPPEFPHEFKNTDPTFWLREFQLIENQANATPDSEDYFDLVDPYMHDEAVNDLINNEPFSIIGRYWWGPFHEQQNH